MRNDKSEQPIEEEALQARVDSMMAAGGEDSTPAVSGAVDLTPTKDKKSDSKSPKTAPKLSKEALAGVKSDEVYKPTLPAKRPIVIKLADEDKPDTTQPAETQPAEAKPPEAQAEPLPPPPVEAVAPTEPETPTEPAEGSKDPLEDSATDKAVDDIVANESDMLLAVDDAKTAQAQKKLAKPRGMSWKDKLRSLIGNKWTWVGLVVVLGLILAVPLTRYKLLGLVVKKSVTVTVVDSKTATPVSNAQVELAGSKVKTDQNGRAHIKASIGPRNLAVEKQYYTSYHKAYFVGLKDTKQPSSVKLVATGRLVPITLSNKITNKPLGGVEVRVLDTTAKTNSQGKAVVALPTKADTYTAKFSLSGYNTTSATIQVTDKAVKANDFKLTPSGHIYFLSNLSGNLDVVKANLDGSGRKTILAGTGKEDANTTSLLASRDWRFLVLKSKRTSNLSAMYLIDTISDKVTPFDNNDADFDLVGWYGHSFIYSLTRNNLMHWQAGRQALKSYDADNLQLNQLDQNQAEGNAGSYAYQNFYNFYITDGTLAYNSQWYTYDASGATYNTTGKTDSIRAILPNGQNKKDYQTFPAGTTGYIQAALYEPQSIYYAVYNSSDNKTTYYEYEDQAVKNANLDNNVFNKTYPTYLLSPSGKQTFWTELRDGKNTLFRGDANAKTKKQIASLSEYSPYGWYSDNYLLVSKNSSELYVMPAGGLTTGQTPVKITDYYKPDRTFTGYGYGYGGL